MRPAPALSGEASAGQPNAAARTAALDRFGFCEMPSLTLLVVALLAALAGRVLLLLLTGLRLLALLLLSRPLLAAALLLTGLLISSLRRLPILVWTIHLSTSWVKIQLRACNACYVDCKLIKK